MDRSGSEWERAVVLAAFLRSDLHRRRLRIMRDPVAPIPSSRGDHRYWESMPPLREPRTSRDEAKSEPFEVNRGDLLGIDRRELPRGSGQTGVERRGEGGFVSSTHRSFDTVLGLRSHHGWALVRTLTLAPSGVLLQLVDPTDPSLDPTLRWRAKNALDALSPTLGSPSPARHGRDPKQGSSLLAKVGTCLLSRRVVADISKWANENTNAYREGLQMELVVPPPTHFHYRPDPTRISCELVPMTDPTPQLLAVALRPSDRDFLELAVRVQTQSTTEPRSDIPRPRSWEFSDSRL